MFWRKSTLLRGKTSAEQEAETRRRLPKGAEAGYDEGLARTHCGWAGHSLESRLQPARGTLSAG